MRKTIALILSFVLVLSMAVSFAGCNDDTVVSSSDSASEPVDSATDDADNSTSSTTSYLTRPVASASGNNSGSTTSGKTDISKKPVYKLPSKTEDIFPNKWTATKNLTDIPTNIKGNIKNGKIHYLSSSKLTDDNMKEISAYFKKLTGKDLEIKYTIVDWLELTNQLQTMVLANKAPDYFSIANSVGVWLRNKGLSRNINDYINMNDAIWKDAQEDSANLFYNDILTSVAAIPNIAFGYSYDKTMIKAAGLEDPFELYKKGKWDINTFMKYAEKLTKKNSSGVTTVYGVSTTSTSLLQMGVNNGKDLVLVNKDGTYSSNLNSPVWSRYAGYAKKIQEFGSMDPLTLNDNGFTKGRCVLAQSYWYANALNHADLKKAGKVGWVPYPKDPAADAYYHIGETEYAILPINSDNPWGGAAFLYALRMQKFARDPEYVQKEKQYYLDRGYTAEEYEYFTTGIYKDLKLVHCNWTMMPNFSYMDLMTCDTESWAVIKERVRSKLDSAIAIQNR